MNVVVKHRVGSGLRKIQFKDLDLDLDNIEVSVHPASALPDEPAGRIQTVMEYAQNGIIPPNRVAELTRMPDIEGILDIELAPQRYVDKFISRVMRNPDEEFTVDKYMLLPYLKDQLVKHYNYAKIEIEDLKDESNGRADMEDIEHAEELCTTLRGLLKETETLIKEQNQKTKGAEGAMAPTPNVGEPPQNMMPPQAGGMVPPMEGEIPPEMLNMPMG